VFVELIGFVRSTSSLSVRTGPALSTRPGRTRAVNPPASDS